MGFTWRKFRLQRIGNFLRNFALHRQDIFKVTVVSFRPKMRVGARVDQLHVHPNFTARPLNCPFQHSGNAKFLRHCFQIVGLALVFRRRGEITFRSCTVASLVKISAWMPSAKYAFAFSSLRFSNGRTAMDFPAITNAEGVGLRKRKTKAATIVASTSSPMATSAERTRARRFCTVSEFARRRRFTELIVIEVHDRDAHAMFHLAFTQIVEIAVPARVRRKILCYMF